MKSENRTLKGLRDIVWDQIDMARSTEPDPRKAFDPKKASTILKAAEIVVDSYKVELAHAVYLKKNKPIEGIGDGDAKTIEAIGHRVDGGEAQEEAGKEPEVGKGSPGEQEGKEPAAG